MTKVALRGLLGRKTRAFLTAFAIILGVAMVSGTFVLTDTIKSAFGTVFQQAYKNADAVITGKSAIGTGGSGGGGNGPEIPSLPASLLTQVRGLPQTAQASGSISDQAQLVGRNGKVISAGGAPGLAFSYSPEGARFNPLTLTSGNWPSNSGEVAIDAQTASKKNFHVGQDIGIIARGPVQHFRIVGTVKFAGVSSLGGATISIFTLAEAQQLFHKQGRYDQINVAAKSGTSPDQLVAAIKPLLGPSAQVRTGQGQAAAGDQGHERLPQHLPGLPARLRRHRAVRGQLRDRQHAVDHDRPADARASDAAHARRLAPAGAPVGPARGAGDRDDRVGHRAVPRAAAGQGAQLAAGLVRDRPAAGLDRVQDADDHRRAGRRHHHHLARGNAARPALDARSRRSPPPARGPCFRPRGGRSTASRARSSRSPPRSR